MFGIRTQVYWPSLTLMVPLPSLLYHVSTLAVANASQSPLTPAHPLSRLFQRLFAWYNFSPFFSVFLCLLSQLHQVPFFPRHYTSTPQSVTRCECWPVPLSSGDFQRPPQFSSVLAFFLREVPWTPVKFCHCFLSYPTVSLTFAQKAADNSQRSGWWYVKLTVHKT